MSRIKPDAQSLLIDLYSLTALRPLIRLPGIAALRECLEAACARESFRALERYHEMFAIMSAAPRLTGEVFRDYWLYSAMTGAKLFEAFDDITISALERDLAVVQLFCRAGGKGIWESLQKTAASNPPDPITRMSAVAWSGASAEKAATAQNAPRAELTPPLWQYSSRVATLDLCAGEDMLELIDAFERDDDWPRLAHSLLGLYQEHGDIAIFSHKRMTYVSGALVPMADIALAPSWEEFVGLDAAQEELARRANGFISGDRADNLLIHGEAGLGKTSLVLAMAGALPARLIAVRAGEFDAGLAKLLREAARQPMKFIVLIDDVERAPDALLAYMAFEQSENVWLVATGRESEAFPAPAKLMLEPPPLKAFIQRVMELARARGAELDYDHVQDACIDWKVDGGELTASAAIKVLGKLV